MGLDIKTMYRYCLYSVVNSIQWNLFLCCVKKRSSGSNKSNMNLLSKLRLKKISSSLLKWNIYDTILYYWFWNWISLFRHQSTIIRKNQRFYRDRCANFLSFCLLGDILITFTGNYFWCNYYYHDFYREKFFSCMV